MKNKLSFISLAAVVGLIGVGFGAWAFGEETSKSQDVAIGIEGAVEGNLGTLNIAAPETYQIKEAALDTITFTATLTLREGVEATDVGAMTYTVSVEAGLDSYITVTGADTHGEAEDGVAEVLNVAWVGEMKPTTAEEYHTLADLLPTLTYGIRISVNVADAR